jgi:hypothetical protein
VPKGINIILSIILATVIVIALIVFISFLATRMIYLIGALLFMLLGSISCFIYTYFESR